MGGRVGPHLIITRPDPDGTRFADQLRAQLGPDVHVIMAPLMQILPLDVQIDAQGFIFTSTNGVAQAVRLGRMTGPAWCVGDRTTDAATAAGFAAKSAKGTAEDVIALVKSEAPTGRIAHVRGEHARGDVGPRLRAAGIDCVDVIAYTQSPIDLPADVVDLIEGAEPIIIPLFSPRATALLMSQATLGPNVQMVAISRQTAGGHQMQIAETPDGHAMVRATVAAYRGLNP